MRPRCARRTTSVLCPAAFQVPRTAWHRWCRWCEHQSRRSLGPWGRPRLLFTALWFLLLLYIYIHMYIYINGICVYTIIIIFLTGSLKKNRCERVKEQKWLLGRGKDSHQLRLFGHLPPPVEDFVGRGHRGGAVPSYRADRDGLFVALRGLSIAFQRNNSDRRVVAW